MPSMTTYSQGDVVLVPFPFTDQSGAKQRPAVVLSGEAYNRDHLDLILAPITSQLLHVPDEVRLTDWSAAGLVKPSLVKPVLSSFDSRLVRRRLGVLSASDLAQVRALFARILDVVRAFSRAFARRPAGRLALGELYVNHWPLSGFTSRPQFSHWQGLSPQRFLPSLTKTFFSRSVRCFAEINGSFPTIAASIRRASTLLPG